jgi:hypothetical protein
MLLGVTGDAGTTTTVTKTRTRGTFSITPRLTGHRRQRSFTISAARSTWDVSHTLECAVGRPVEAVRGSDRPPRDLPTPILPAALHSAPALGSPTHSLADSIERKYERR